MVGSMAIIRSGFGTRTVSTENRELIVVDNRDDDDRAELVNDESHIAIKEQVRTLLLARIDPGVAARMPRSHLVSEVGRLVNEIADQTRFRLNEREEAILADELVDDMVGL